MSNSKITPFLWFNNNAEEAMNFYAAIFKNATINPAAGTFELEGQKFLAFNGGPMFQFTEAISLFVSCETQEEVDFYWEKLSEGGAKSRCGWLKDKFGLWWQVIPTTLGQLLSSKEPGVSKRTVEAMMKMDKIIIADLKKAAEQK